MGRRRHRADDLDRLLVQIEDRVRSEGFEIGRMDRSPLTPAQKNLAKKFIAEEARAGYPRAQAIAIGLSRARRGR